MRTIQAIDSEVQSLIANRSVYSPRELSSARKRITFLNTCKAYLKDMPSEDFLRKERDRINNRVKLISEGYDYWKSCQMKGKNSIDDYNKEMGVSDLMLQLKTIYFLLNE
jgi:hypothetical protein